MLKPLTILILSLLVFQIAKAQKQDTLLYYMKNSGEIVYNKDSADYFTLIFPADSNSDKKLYPVIEYYPNGKRKLVGTTTTSTAYLNLTGPCVTFFTNGRRESVSNFDGYKIDQTTYYDNGKLQNIRKYRDSTELLIECRDSTGNILAENGKGKWIGPENSRDLMGQKVILEGNVSDSLKDGQWHGSIGDIGKFVSTFSKGRLVSGVGYDKLGKAHAFVREFVQPAFDKSNGTYANFLMKNVHYPAVARENNIQGRVIVAFIVEKDGKPTNFNVLTSPDPNLSLEVMRVVALTKWTPAILYGMPIRSYFTLPMSFKLGN